ncbi:MAG: rod shape-determining protein [Peptococcaceae bacterium]|nr:rod shape-determining protein [Peptococcaceae bacterium]
MANVARDIGIDLGTANSLVYIKGKGIVLQEPSVVAINTLGRDVLAVGEEARQMIGRTPSNIVAIRPLKDGVIADFDTTRSMLKYFIARAIKGNSSPLHKPKILVGVPLGITPVEERAIQEAAQQAGARQAFVIEEPLAAAIGAGLPVEDPLGSMIIDIGGGTSEIAVISLGGIVKGHSLRMAGDSLNEAIVRHLRRTRNLDIGDRTAEAVKIAIGYAMEPDPKSNMEVRGRNITNGLPCFIKVTAEEVHAAIQEPIKALVDAIKSTLEQTPAELASDIMQTGITLAGGGALLRNLDLLLNRVTGVPVLIAEDPLTCVARGTGMALEGGVLHALRYHPASLNS